MLWTFLLPAGLGAALFLGGLAAGPDLPVSQAHAQTAWVEQGVQNVVPGQAYRLDGCFTVAEVGLTYVALRIVWHPERDGYGSPILREDQPAEPGLVGVEQCLSLTDAHAPCAALSARFGVVVKGDATVEVSRLEFAPDPEGAPVACPSPTSTPTPTSTATPTAAPVNTPTPVSRLTVTPTPTTPGIPTATATATPEPQEPTVFPALVNGGFEDLRDDRTPYGWRKFGGDVASSEDFHAQGSHSAALVSRTESTKWLYQAVAVRPGAFYRFQAKALYNDLSVQQVWLRTSWYASADASGSQLDTADSDPLLARSVRFASMDTGPIQAPREALSAKVRLMVRPTGSATATVYFDDVRFDEVPTPTPTPTPATNPTAIAQSVSAPPSSPTPERPVSRAAEEGRQPGPAILGARRAPVPPANVREERVAEPASAATGERLPVWAIALALSTPTAALAVMGGNAWWTARLARRNRPHL